MTGHLRLITLSILSTVTVCKTFLEARKTLTLSQREVTAQAAAKQMRDQEINFEAISLSLSNHLPQNIFKKNKTNPAASSDQAVHHLTNLFEQAYLQEAGRVEGSRDRWGH